MSLSSNTADTSSKTSTSRHEITSTRNTSPPRPISLGDVVTDDFPPFIVKFNNSTLDPKIEKLYGPFEDPPLWAFPQTIPTKIQARTPVTPTRTAKPIPNPNPDDISLQITKLKALIQEREKLVTKRTSDTNTNTKTNTNQSTTVVHVSHSPTLPVSVQNKDKNQSNISNNSNDTSPILPSSVHITSTTLEKQLVEQSSTYRKGKELLDKPLLRGQPTSSSHSDLTEAQPILPVTSNKIIEKRYEDEEPSNNQSKESQLQQLELNMDIVDKQTTTRPIRRRTYSSSQRIVKPTPQNKYVDRVMEWMNKENNSTNGDSHTEDIGTGDPEFDKYLQEQQNYDDLLADIRFRMEKAQMEIDYATTEKARLQAYINKKNSTSPMSLSPSTSTSSLGNRKKSIIDDNFESTGRSQKRQKQSRDSLPSTLGNTYADVVVGGLSPSNSTFQDQLPLNRPVTRSISTLQNQLLTTKPSQPNQPTEIKHIYQTMEVFEYFNEFADLVRIRAINNDILDDLLNYNGGTTTTTTTVGSSPQIQQLVTLDDMTFTCDSFRLPEASKYLAVDTTQFKPIRYHESTLLAMVIDGVPRPNVLPVKVMNSLTEALAEAPTHLKDFLTNYQHGEVCPGLEPMINIIYNAISVHGNMELIWVTYTELMVYCHGYSQEVASSFLSAQQHHPFSLELFWQTIFCVPEYRSRSALTTELLRSITLSRSNTSFHATSELISEKTTEVLLRTLRFDGLRGVLDQLVPETDSNLNDAGCLIQLSLNNVPAYVFINDHDLCFILLSVITFYVFGRLPNDLNRQHWFERVTKTGDLTPSGNPLFVLDWSKSDVTLNDIQQTVVVTVLLEMLRYFVGKARSNEAKKPLMMMVWRNIVGLLEVLECYGRASTLMLLRQHLDTTWKIKPLRSEWVDMIFDLERKIQGHDTKTSDALWQRIIEYGTVAAVKSLPFSLFLSYKAATLLEPKKDMDGDKLLSAAWRLARPLWVIYDRNTTARLNKMKAREPPAPRPTDSSLALINYLCGLYSSALGLTDTFEILQRPHFSILEFRKMPIAWINALYIHLIHFWLTNDYLFMDSFLQEVSVPWILEQIDTKEGRVLYHRFKKDCTTLLIK